MYAIIELNGENGAGKTTLATALGVELSPASVLFIDASLDQKLTQTLSLAPPTITLARLFSQTPENTRLNEDREAIDWAFNDLTVTAGEDQDVLTVGGLETELPPAARDKLHYGLTRLIEAYDYVIIDDHHPLIHQLLPDENLRTLIVLTPTHIKHWQPPAETVRTPSLILNQYDNEPLPEHLETVLRQGQAKLIGKLPRYATPEDCIRRLPDDFRNCLLRLNIPLNLPHP